MPIIVVSHNKGGTGKTTTAFNLMHALKPDHVLDQDLHDGLRVLSQLRAEPLAFELEHYQSAETMLAALQRYAEADKTVLVDCGAFDSDITRAAVAVADLIIVPANDTPTERLGLGRFDATLAEISETIGRDIKAHLLICKAHPSQKHFPKLDSDLSQARHLTRLETVIAMRPDHYRSHEEGLGVTERTATRHTAAGLEVLALAEEIRQLLEIKTAA